MLHFLHLALRVLAGIAGATAIYAALFLYEDEQGKIENRLEEWWIRLDDQRNAAVSRHTAFMREVARLSGQGFDRLFGHRLFSVQAFGVSSALSMSALSAFMILFYWMTLPSWSAALLVLMASIFVGCGIAPAFSGRKIASVIVFFPLTLVIGTFAVAGGLSLLAPGVVLATMVSFASDLLFIGATRWILRWGSSLRSLFEILGVVVTNILLAALLIGGPYWLTQSFSIDALLPNRLINALEDNLALASTLEQAVDTLWILNVVDGLVGSVFIILALSMLAHRLFWPLINRPLYALRERGVRRRVFALVGVALLVYAGVNVPDLVRQAIEKGAG